MGLWQGEPGRFVRRRGKLPERTFRKGESKVSLRPSLPEAAGGGGVDAPLPLDGPLSDVCSTELPTGPLRRQFHCLMELPAETLFFFLSLHVFIQISTYHFTLLSWVILSIGTLFVHMHEHPSHPPPPGLPI